MTEDRSPVIAVTPATVQTGDITAGRDVNFGLTPEQVKELTEAAVRGATAPLTRAIVDLSKRLGITEDATKTLLRIVGEQDVPLERLSETLNRVANDFKKLQAQAAALNLDNPTARDLVTQAKVAIDAGQFEPAHQLLREATQVQLAAAQAARKLREQAQAAEDAQMLGAASATAVDAGLALTEGKYEQAAELFGQAAEYVPPEHPDERGGYLSDQAHALYRQGDERGDNAALVAASAIWDELAAREHSRDRVPLVWALTQNNLGKALRVLGERGDDDALLRAVDTCQAALQELTRESAPRTWAAIQSNLGNTLRIIGERGDDETLCRAVKAHEAALDVYTRESAPLDWAAERNNLGLALQALGKWRTAIEAYHDALQVYLRERERFASATALTNLGNVLQILAARGDDAALRMAVDAHKDALLIYTQERSPLLWATAQVNLGSALVTLGERGNDDAPIDAIEALEAALKVYYAEQTPLLWAITQNHLGNALRLLGTRGDEAALHRAAGCYKAALDAASKLSGRTLVETIRRNLVRIGLV